MNYNKRRPFSVTRVALMAVLSLLLLFGACAIVIFSTFHNDILDNEAKVQAGDLKISATYQKIEGTMLDADATSSTYGKLVAFSQDKNLNLSNEQDNIFDISGAVPAMSQTATFAVKNNGNISFDCEIRICDLLVDNAKSADVALSNQMLIKIACGTSVKEFILSDCDKEDSMLIIEDIAPDEEKTFSISAIFLNSDDYVNQFDNSDAMGGNASFDITIIATQCYDFANN